MIATMATLVTNNFCDGGEKSHIRAIVPTEARNQMKCVPSSRRCTLLLGWKDCEGGRRGIRAPGGGGRVAWGMMQS